MLLKTKGIRLLFYFAIVVGGILPIVLYWFYIGRVPTITPQEAMEFLSKPGSAAVLVDIRTPEEFEDNRLYGAQNWPYDSIMALSSRDSIPQQFDGKHLILLYKSGIKSASAVRKLKKMEVPNIYNVRGGMELWVRNAKAPYSLEFYKLIKKSGETKNSTFRKMTLFEQWIVIIYAFIIKYTYMLLSLGLVVILWRSKSLDLKALKWGMAFFFIGESFCALNSYIYHETSYLFEYFHSFGMVLSFGFVVFSIFEGVDRRIIKLTNPKERCAALGLCRSCIKYADAPCGLKRLFHFITPACIAISFISLSAAIQWVSYNTNILGTNYDYSNAAVRQLFEIRFCPIIAIVLFTLTMIILLFKKDDPITPSKVLFSGGVGYLGFGLFRLIIFAPYRENLVWKAFWEELTELIFVVGVGITLWVFRHRLFRKDTDN